MTIEESFVTVLRVDAGVSAIIGDGNAARIYAMLAPAGAPMPLIVYQRISGAPDTTMDNVAGPVSARLQVTSLASDYPTARALSAAVRAALHCYTGGIIQSCFEVSQGDLVDAEPEDDGNRTFGFRSDFQVFANES